MCITRQRLSVSAVGAKDSSREDPAKESAVSSGLADSLTSVLTLTVREDQHIRLNPEQALTLNIPCLSPDSLMLGNCRSFPGAWSFAFPC